MGKALAELSPAARYVFESADEALGEPISKLCFEGPDDALKQTEVTQPAILTTSIACWAALREKNPITPAFVAGHSLGEWSALVAVGALSLKDAVRAVRTRGRLMQDAVPPGEGAMAAVMGFDGKQVASICEAISATGKIVAPANYNSTEQLVISGSAAGVTEAAEACRAAGAKKVQMLAVSAPFHCPLMAPAAQGLAAAIESLEVKVLSAPVVTNVEAEPNQDPLRVKSLLVQQVTAPVRWVEIMQKLASLGVTRAIEIGPGKVLQGLQRRIDRNLEVLNVQDPESLEKTLAALAA